MRERILETMDPVLFPKLIAFSAISVAVGLAFRDEIRSLIRAEHLTTPDGAQSLPNLTEDSGDLVRPYDSKVRIDRWPNLSRFDFHLPGSWAGLWGVLFLSVWLTYWSVGLMHAACAMLTGNSTVFMVVWLTFALVGESVAVVQWKRLFLGVFGRTRVSFQPAGVYLERRIGLLRITDHIPAAEFGGTGIDRSGAPFLRRGVSRMLMPALSANENEWLVQEFALAKALAQG